jgi:hypothetical protein
MENWASNVAASLKMRRALFSRSVVVETKCKTCQRSRRLIEPTEMCLDCFEKWNNSDVQAEQVAGIKWQMRKEDLL